MTKHRDVFFFVAVSSLCNFYAFFNYGQQIVWNAKQRANSIFLFPTFQREEKTKWCKIYINRDIFLLFFLQMHALHCNVSASDILPYHVEISSFQLMWQIYYFFNVCRGTILSKCVNIKFPQSVRTYHFINTGT